MVDVTIIPPPLGPQLYESQSNTVLFQVDCGLSYVHSQAAQIAEHPVEEGSDISDHRQVRQPRLRLEGISSARPILADDEDGTGIEHLDAFDRLLEIFLSDQVFDIVTPKRFYENMQMASISVPDDAARGSVTEYSVELVQVEFVTSQTVTLKPAPGVRNEKAKRGKKPVTEAGAGATTGSRSALSQFFTSSRSNQLAGG